ncbi:MAG: DUF4270 domain-containing protein [Prevotellaceae bacterium]|nr:DUF4270 domain-containing protein [Candidatus Colivivens equi]MCQ2076637.1 DUF4270 domain-containing protein [Bacteroidaceae bacterium]
MKRLILYTFVSVLVLCSCDDNTDTLGSGMMPSQDIIHSAEATYYATTRTVPAGDVLARSSVSYLGRFTDPETETSIKSDFLAQFHCTESFEFPDSVVNHYIKKIDLRLYVQDFIGDSIQPLKISVYPLDSVLNPDIDYYTNIVPETYYDNTKQPLVQKWFTIADYTIEDSERWGDKHFTNICINLPHEIGQQIYDTYLKRPECFKNAEAFIKSGITGAKGFYFKLEAGDGALAYIDISKMNVYYDWYDSATDSVYVDCSNSFGSTEEVIQATRFENTNLQKLINDSTSTYVKSPAGLFTEIEFPIDDFLASQHKNDSINSVKLTLTRYNDRVQSDFKLSIPQNVLLVRCDDYKGYFENYKVADSQTSYLATYSAKTNTYNFNNLSPLISQMVTERRNGTASPNYNKVYVIPVLPTYDTSNYLVKLCHDFSMSSARLVGGNDKIKLNVVYATYNTK